MKRSKVTLSVIATLLVLAVVGLLVAPGFSSEGGGAGNPAALVSNALPGGCGMWGNPGTTNKADVAAPDGGQQYCYQRNDADDAAGEDADAGWNCPMGAGIHGRMMHGGHHGMMSGGHHGMMNGMMGGMMGGMHSASMHGNGNWNCWNTADTQSADTQNDENFNCWNGTDTQDADAGWNCPIRAGMHGSDQGAANCPMWGASGEDNEASKAR